MRRSGAGGQHCSGEKAGPGGGAFLKDGEGGGVAGGVAVVGGAAAEGEGGAEPVSWSPGNNGSRSAPGRFFRPLSRPLRSSISAQSKTFAPPTTDRDGVLLHLKQD